MKFKCLLILIQAFVVCESGFCQKKDKDHDAAPAIIDDAKANPSNLEKARFQINDVKNRGIIVRLKTNMDRIASYRKAGYKKLADKLEEKSKNTNLLLEYAFITEWSYCPVYFMESEHTALLMQTDTLIARTFDLKRDTIIYMNHDSFYIVDFGDLMANEGDAGNPLKYSHESTSPVSGSFIVVKDANQEQLQPPMPYNAKVWLDELTTTDKIVPIELPGSLTESISRYLSNNKGINELLRSDAKMITTQYMDTVYQHIHYESKKVPGVNQHADTSQVIFAGSFDHGAKASQLGSGPAVIMANPFQSGAKRLNQQFIDYYCKRLGKDKNILSSDEPYYWWQRNPNIRYLPHLHDLETELKQSMDQKPNPTK